MSQLIKNSSFELQQAEIVTSIYLGYENFSFFSFSNDDRYVYCASYTYYPSQIKIRKIDMEDWTIVRTYSEQPSSTVYSVSLECIGDYLYIAISFWTSFVIYKMNKDLEIVNSLSIQTSSTGLTRTYKDPYNNSVLWLTYRGQNEYLTIAKVDLTNFQITASRTYTYQDFGFYPYGPANLGFDSTYLYVFTVDYRFKVEKNNLNNFYNLKTDMTLGGDLARNVIVTNKVIVSGFNLYAFDRNTLEFLYDFAYSNFNAASAPSTLVYFNELESFFAIDLYSDSRLFCIKDTGSSFKKVYIWASYEEEENESYFSGHAVKYDNEYYFIYPLEDKLYISKLNKNYQREDWLFYGPGIRRCTDAYDGNFAVKFYSSEGYLEQQISPISFPRRYKGLIAAKAEDYSIIKISFFSGNTRIGSVEIYTSDYWEPHLFSFETNQTVTKIRIKAEPFYGDTFIDWVELVCESEEPKKGIAAQIYINDIEIGYASEVNIDIETELEALYTIDTHEPSKFLPGKVKITGSLRKAWVNVNYLRLFGYGEEFGQFRSFPFTLKLVKDNKILILRDCTFKVGNIRINASGYLEEEYDFIAEDIIAGEEEEEEGGAVI